VKKETSSRTSSQTSSDTACRFNHENLVVYQRSLSFAGAIHAQVRAWAPRHAIADHLPRAAESVVENIAMASASLTKAKQNILDVSLGSVLECAACIDIALMKCLVIAAEATVRKQELVEIYRMLIGLRRSWSGNVVRDGGVIYGETDDAAGASSVTEAKNQERQEAPVRFGHERLDIYRLSLEVMSWFCRSESESRLGTSNFRRLDTLATSVILNIAEGNGRFSGLDHRRFLGIAHRSAIKMAAQLDLCALAGTLGKGCALEGKHRLARIAKMAMAMTAGIERPRIDEVRDEARDEVAGRWEYGQTAEQLTLEEYTP
jgi:four helix bundle protein